MTSKTAGWVYTDGSEAYHWTVRICLVDAENPERQRVMEAQSGSPPKIVDNKWIGGTHILDGVEYDAAKSIQELLVIMLKRAAKQMNLGRCRGRLAPNNTCGPPAIVVG